MECCVVALCGMVWYGMLWNDMVWYSMVWYGTMWYYIVWCGVVWYGMVWFGMKSIVCRVRQTAHRNSSQQRSAHATRYSSRQHAHFCAAKMCLLHTKIIFVHDTSDFFTFETIIPIVRNSTHQLKTNTSNWYTTCTHSYISFD